VVRTFRETHGISAMASSTTKDVRHRAEKWTVGPERRKGLGTSRADVSGNARHFCDGELNFINKLKQCHFKHLQMYA
ncbi:hypothetical protein, partial [Granulicatella adiacens]|uniref:hypothetical protein n=1 Tax=Granulicatella adiacens TaxID=46124 RepID=UPI00241F5DB1